MNGSPDSEAVRSKGAAHRSAADGAQHSAQAVRARPVRAWPVVLLALPAFVAIWSGWVGLGQLTGFGPVRPLPGIVDNFTVNTAITLPIGMEAYASYALYVWLSGRIRSDRTRSYAKYSAFGSLTLGAVGQVAYHLMQAAGMTTAPWPITVLVACLPVAVLGMGAALAHMILREHHDQNAVRTTGEPTHHDSDLRTTTVHRPQTETAATAIEPNDRTPTPTLELVQRTALEPTVRTDIDEHTDPWDSIAAQICQADPSGRRDPDKVAEILRLRHEHNWPHARIADHVNLSASAVTRTLTAAQEYTTEDPTMTTTKEEAL